MTLLKKFSLSLLQQQIMPPNPQISSQLTIDILNFVCVSEKNVFISSYLELLIHFINSLKK